MLNPQCLLCLVARNLQLESSHRCGGEEGGRSQRYPPTSRTSELRSDSLHRLEPRTQPLEERLFFRICSFTTPLWMRSGKSGEELKQQLPCVTSLKAWKDQFLVHIIALFLPFISWWRDIPHKYFFVWDSKRKDGWTYSHFHVQAGRGPLSLYKRLNAKTTNDSLWTGGGSVVKSKITQCTM